MRLVAIRKLCLIAAGIGITAGLACSDSTSPTLSRRIAGTYALTTALQSYTYSTTCQPTTGAPVCTDTTVDASASKLNGTFRLVSASSRSSGDMEFTITDANLHEVDCREGTSPCGERVESLSGEATVTGGSLAFVAAVYGGMTFELHGTVVGDEIRGDLTWRTYTGCCAHQYYLGTFAAKRQP